MSFVLAGWWNGIHAGLKILWRQRLAGSSPALATVYITELVPHLFYFTLVFRVIPQLKGSKLIYDKRKIYKKTGITRSR